MLRCCIQAMTFMMNTSDRFSRVVRFGDDGEIDINDYVYYRDIQSGKRFIGEAPAPPDYLEATRLAFSAWTSEDDPAGAMLRAQALVAYERLAARDAALWDKLFPPQLPPPKRFSDPSQLLAALKEHPKGRITFRVGKYGRTDIFYLYPSAGDAPPIGEYVAWDCDETCTALYLLDDATRTDTASFWFNEISFFHDAALKPLATPLRFALHLYKRRMAAQMRVLRGEIRRGPRAFGFLPLDGYG